MHECFSHRQIYNTEDFNESDNFTIPYLYVSSNAETNYMYHARYVHGANSTDRYRGINMTEEFEPNILAFCCNWCSYAGADLAGVSRFQYPTNIRIIRVMCSGRVEPAFILEALKDGADGILITGCHIGDCHYIDGNRNAEIRINNTMEALKYLGLDGRLRLEWVSASEGARFAEVVKEFTEEIEKLGPSPLKAA